MKYIYKIVLAITAVLCFGQNLAANEQVELKEHFLKKIDEIILIVAKKEFTKDERNGKIVKSLTPMFDFELMAKLSLGNRWKDLSDTEKEKFVALYVERMKQSYSSKIDAYKDEKVEIKKVEQAKEDRITLVTDLVSKTEKLEIAYKFHKPKKPIASKDSWLIYDVEILGVSILKTDIAQFKEFLHTKSMSELMDALAKQS
ncbi:MAG: ABC transporter substrate-binding protein [Sulfurimonas sp.]|uniref:Tgt2/MlaC family protein n=1 Tax=Sulfurimonas sp. TaxID=2022749 RepID=UPI0026096D99|nr:ABC transporter substrate-binding protein [Sulfurimonas sp.]MDD2653174.1 ABC transporter substrate-binding protein [Sulfurimonas sp.]MDD3450596.1 ABC transporter substrate-binding protein [Sulfurimonas sp.]